MVKWATFLTKNQKGNKCVQLSMIYAKGTEWKVIEIFSIGNLRLPFTIINQIIYSALV